jgi:hypothetical protein
MGSWKNIWKAVGIPERNTPHSSSLAEKVFQKKNSLKNYTMNMARAIKKMKIFYASPQKTLPFHSLLYILIFCSPRTRSCQPITSDTSFGPVFLLKRLMIF